MGFCFGAPNTQDIRSDSLNDGTNQQKEGLPERSPPFPPFPSLLPLTSILPSSVYSTSKVPGSSLFGRRMRAENHRSSILRCTIDPADHSPLRPPPPPPPPPLPPPPPKPLPLPKVAGLVLRGCTNLQRTHRSESGYASSFLISCQ